MKNPLKKFTPKTKKQRAEELTNLTGLTGKLVEEKAKLIEKNKDLDIRCQSLELTVTQLQRKNAELERTAFESRQKAVKLQQELHEARFMAAAYDRMADKAVLEKVRLKKKYDELCESLTCKTEQGEVSENG